MEDEVISNSFLQVYNVTDEDILPSQVDFTIGIITQRGMMVAGLSAHKEILSIHYSGYGNDRVVWDISFFEQVIANEPFFSEPEKVKAIFVLTDKNMIVPGELYKENHAKVWLKHLHFVEQDDVIDSFQLEADRAMYLMAIPGHIKTLLRNNFRNASIKPMALYQFQKPPKIGLCLQACISYEQACATLHIDGNLLWHRVFDYSAAEDIVFEGKYLCKEHNYFATRLSIMFNSITGAEFPVLSDYSQYYPAMKSGEGNRIHSSWDAPLTLVRQLLPCV